MNYVITGGAGNISAPITRALLVAGHNVTLIGRNETHLQPLVELGAKAAIGDVENIRFLTDTFKGNDVAYTMVPPKWDAADWKGYIGSIGENYAAAIEAAGIENVVNLSSTGAHMAEGCGPVSGLHKVEHALDEMANVNIRHLRPGSFYQNLLANIPLIKSAGIMGGNFGGDDTKLIMVHPEDIAKAALEELLTLKFSGTSVRYIAGDEKTGAEIAAIIGAAIGIPGLPWVQFPDDQYLDGLLKAGLSNEVAKNYTEMGTAARSGLIATHYWQHHPSLSPIKMEDFAKEFAAAFNAQ